MEGAKIQKADLATGEASVTPSLYQKENFALLTLKILLLAFIFLLIDQKQYLVPRIEKVSNKAKNTIYFSILPVIFLSLFVSKKPALWRREHE